MGYFKTVSKRRLRKKKIIIHTFVLAFLFYIVNYYFEKYPAEEKQLVYLTENIFGKNLKFKEKEKTVFEEISVEKKPIVYIFNSHQTEKYKYNKLSSYNIDYTVMFASYILEAYLEDYNISSLVETNLISKILNENGWKYKDSYKASRILLEQRFKNNPTLAFFIDLHRDSSSYEKTTCTLDGVSYAKVLFVVGKEHENYEQNLEVANKLNEKIKKINPCFSRGLMQKEGEGVNGIYNQDFNKNTVLMEIGGQYNYIDEVNNILKIVASVVNEYIKENL